MPLERALLEVVDSVRHRVVPPRIPLPVVGLKAYEETLRFVFCQEETVVAGRVVPALVVHLVGVINGGMAVGQFE